jgi:hypothetical protein
MLEKLNQLKAALVEVKAVTEININQIDNGKMGALSNSFLVNGSPIITKALIDYLKANQVKVINDIKASIKKELDTERIRLIAEMEAVILVEKALVVS